MKEKLGGLASSVGEKTDGALQKAGETLSGAASTIWDKAPMQGPLGNTIGNVVAGMDQSGEYLAHHGVGDIAHDVTAVLGKYPVQTLFVGIGFGLLLGAAISRR